MNGDFAELDESLLELMVDLRDVTKTAAISQPVNTKLLQSLKRIDDELQRGVKGSNVNCVGAEPILRRGR